MSHLPPMVPLHEVAAELRKATHVLVSAAGRGVTREVPQVAAQVAKARAKKKARQRAIRRARPPVLVLSEHSLSTHGESIVSSLPATHSPLWLLPAGLSDDELMAGYGGGVW